MCGHMRGLAVLNPYSADRLALALRRLRTVELAGVALAETVEGK